MRFKSQEEIDNHAQQDGAGLGRIRYKDLNGDGKITEADQDWIYNPTPDFTWGLNIYLQYKNFDFTMFWQGVQGVDVNCYDYKKETDFWANTGVNVPYLNKGVRVLDAWSPANPGSDIPALTTADRNHEGSLSSYYIENGCRHTISRMVHMPSCAPYSWATTCLRASPRNSRWIASVCMFLPRTC